MRAQGCHGFQAGRLPDKSDGATNGISSEIERTNGLAGKHVIKVERALFVLTL
jgi:hypothetical protein